MARAPEALRKIILNHQHGLIFTNGLQVEQIGWNCERYKEISGEMFVSIAFGISFDKIPLEPFLELEDFTRFHQQGRTFVDGLCRPCIEIPRDRIVYENVRSGPLFEPLKWRYQRGNGKFWVQKGSQNIRTDERRTNTHGFLNVFTQKPLRGNNGGSSQWISARDDVGIP